MCHADTDRPKFTDLLTLFDQDLANQTREQGCPYCKGRLHRACFPRKPRGGGPELGEDYQRRISFCCSDEECRKRTTPPSVRFLGRRVYLAAVVVLAACLEQGLTERRVAQLGLYLEVPRRTLKRWRGWWLGLFVHTAFWQHARARLMPAVDAGRLPASLFERFADADIAQQLVRLLKFLSPLSTRAASTLSEIR